MGAAPALGQVKIDEGDKEPMDALWIGLAVGSFTLYNVMIRQFQLRQQRSASVIQLFQAGFCLVSAVFNMGFVLREPPLPPLMLLMGAAFGVLFYATCACSAHCYGIGPMSITTVLMNLSFVIPLAYSSLFWGEVITPVRWVGLAFLCLTFVLPFQGTGTTERRASMQWFRLASLAFLFNGLLAVLQKQQQMMADGAGKGTFMAVGYMVACLCFLIHYGRMRRQGPAKVVSRLVTAGMIVLAGLGSFLGNRVIIMLATKVEAVILYPCVNGGLAVATSVLSFLALGERLTRQKAAAIVAGIIAIVLLNL